MATDLKGLQNFKQKLLNLKNIDTNEIANAIADEGVKIANFEYSIPIYNLSTKERASIKVNKEYAIEGKSSVVAYGDQVAFIEFGTGNYARGTYEGDLPKSGVPITGQWEYYYDNPETKKTIGGQHGWFLNNGIFVTGHSAGNQMYRTAKSLRENSAYIVKKVIRRKENSDV